MSSRDGSARASVLVLVACALVACAMACLVFTSVALFANSDRAYAADSLTTGSVTSNDSDVQTMAAKNAVAAKKAVKKKKKGNCDKIIGLGKSKMVFATGKVSITIRTKASSKSAKKSSFQRKSCIVVDTKGMKLGKNYKWLKVKLRGKSRGYVKTSQVKLTVVDLKTFGLDVSKKKNKRRAKICRYGLKYLGVPYSHTSGPIWSTCDCGAFAKYCLRHGGYKVLNGNLGYLLHRGKPVSRKHLKPGDLVFYPTNERPLAHVAVYIGYGLIVNQSGQFGTVYPRGGARVSTLDYRSPTCNRFRNVVGN